MSISQQIAFAGKLEEHDGAAMFFVAEKQYKTILNFSLDSLLQNNIITGTSKILNLLNDANDSKFVTTKWNIVNDNSNSKYAAANEITSDAEILKSYLYDYNDAYILVTGGITVVAVPATQVAFKNCVPYTKL